MGSHGVVGLEIDRMDCCCADIEVSRHEEGKESSESPIFCQPLEGGRVLLQAVTHFSGYLPPKKLPFLDDFRRIDAAFESIAVEVERQGSRN